jgi:hypothetical protein
VRSIVQDKIVAVDYLIAATVAQQSLYFTAFVPDQRL